MVSHEKWGIQTVVYALDFRHRFNGGIRRERVSRWISGRRGGGWEFFANNSLAVGIAFEGDYMFRTVNDFAMIGFMFNMKYY